MGIYHLSNDELLALKEKADRANLIGSYRMICKELRRRRGASAIAA